MHYKIIVFFNFRHLNFEDPIFRANFQKLPFSHIFPLKINIKHLENLYSSVEQSIPFLLVPISAE